MPDGNAGASPIRRTSLRQQIADALRDEVLTGRLPSGRGFTVKEIAELYGVSATPVREALVDLAAQGLLDLEQHRGFQVRRFSPADFVTMVEARGLVTEGIFRRIGSRETPATALASVRRRAEAAARAARTGELDVLVGCDIRFWREATALGGNPHIVEFLDRIRTQAWICAVPHLRAQPRLSGLCWSGHAELVDALRDEDADTAHAILVAYDDHALRLMERIATGRT